AYPAARMHASQIQPTVRLCFGQGEHATLSSVARCDGPVNGPESDYATHFLNSNCRFAAAEFDLVRKFLRGILVRALLVARQKYQGVIVPPYVHPARQLQYFSVFRIFR